MRLGLRWKAFLLLLVFSLVPVLVLRGMNVQHARGLMSEVKERSRDELANIVRSDLQGITRGMLDIMDAQGTAIAMATRIIAGEVPKAFLGSLDYEPAEEIYYSDGFSIGIMPPDVKKSVNYLKRDRNGEDKSLEVSYNHATFRVVASEETPGVVSDIWTLSSLEPVLKSNFEQLRRLPYWMTVVMESGIEMSYPGHAGFPKHYDPRRTDWYRQTRGGDDFYWTIPVVDPVTRRSMAVLSVPIRDGLGNFMGAVAMYIRLEDIFRETDMVRAWSDDVYTYLVHPWPETGEKKQALAISAGREYSKPVRNWTMPLEQRFLASDDPEAFKRFMGDYLAGNSRVVRMPFKGEDSLWAYSSRPEYGLVVIVPMRVANELPDMLAGIFDEFFEEQKVDTGGQAMIILIIVTLVALRGSKRFVEPLMNIARGLRRVAEGDFSVRIDQRLGDERDHLVETINMLGPRLREHMEMVKEMEVGQNVQNLLLPSEHLDIPGYDVDGSIIYSAKLGGDYYDYLKVAGAEGEAHAVVVGDVSGHGLDSALIMATARALLQGLSGAKLHLSNRIGLVNRFLNSDLDCSGRFITLFYLQLSEENAQIKWIRAGHDPALLYDPDTEEFSELDGEGLPLGVLSDVTFEANQRELAPGQVLAVGTDGIWETVNRDGEMFGKERLREIIRRNHHRSAAEIRRLVFDDLHWFHGGGKPDDDITLVVIKRNET